ncbi:GNAT family N-acetyltransferase [Tessaracoccus sp. HDW20]|uniref:GNAT family N-acetyltransferase n=1 Tax=Tessaracoccus coleopterorum TaxID=2714950 RepID=UPI0018D35287|nr:GNAT family N-acetyltransferase [Tessaracoccus coleopterorum]
MPEADGITIEAFRPDDAEAVRELHNLCFTPFGGAEVSAAEWHAHLEEASFRPGWSFVARDGDRIVGYEMSVLEDGTSIGWTERFGVHPDHRGRGISLALLGNCLAAMRDSGCTEAGIGIDTPDGLALSRLSSVLGYRQRDAVALLSRVV